MILFLLCVLVFSLLCFCFCYYFARKKALICKILSVMLGFLGVFSGFMLYGWIVLTYFDRPPPGSPEITREELINATICPMPGDFYRACETFRSTASNTERFTSAQTFVPVLKKYVVRKPGDEEYIFDLSFTNIVFLLGQGTSMTTNKLVYDVSTEENPDTRVEFRANPPPVVNSIDIISGPSNSILRVP